MFRQMGTKLCHNRPACPTVGPFYCPEDQKVYLDLGFFQELEHRFGAPGQFAQAYVIAHKIAHHVQRLLGIQSKVRRLQAQDPRSRNQLSVRIELQADCFAGVWGNSTEQRNIVDETDVAQGLNAAAAVGDDRLQRMAHGRVSPESFTHGSSAQRTAWLSAGCSRATSLTVILSRLHKFAAGGPPTSRELIQNCWL